LVKVRAPARSIAALVAAKIAPWSAAAITTSRIRYSLFSADGASSASERCFHTCLNTAPDTRPASTPASRPIGR
jgi:hypothetical protein